MVGCGDRRRLGRNGGHRVDAGLIRARPEIDRPASGSGDAAPQIVPAPVVTQSGIAPSARADGHTRGALLRWMESSRGWARSMGTGSGRLTCGYVELSAPSAIQSRPGAWRLSVNAVCQVWKAQDGRLRSGQAISAPVRITAQGQGHKVRVTSWPTPRTSQDSAEPNVWRSDVQRLFDAAAARKILRNDVGAAVAEREAVRRAGMVTMLPKTT